MEWHFCMDFLALLHHLKVSWIHEKQVFKTRGWKSRRPLRQADIAGNPFDTNSKYPPQSPRENKSTATVLW